MVWYGETFVMVVAIIIANRSESVKLILYIARKNNLGSIPIFNKQGFVNSRSVIKKEIALTWKYCIFVYYSL